MAMNPRTHKRGSPPNFDMDGLPPNPRPNRVTNAMWWLICMHDRLEPASAHGGDYVNKAGGHNAGENLPDYGEGDPRTDHSIRRGPDRRGPWWKKFTCAEDWTFTNAHHGDYTQMNLYSRRLYNAMKDPNDTRPDDTFQYFIGQTDKDRQVEGWNEYKDDDESGDESHLWHQHRQYRRNIVGLYSKMWQILTIDMGWTYAEYLKSLEADVDLTPKNLQDIADKVWSEKRWASATPVSMADALQQAAQADNALAAVNSLTQLVMQQSGQTAEAIAAALAPLILAGLPGDIDLTRQDVEEALSNVLRVGVGS
jgi:hypothetical protein